MKIGEYGCRALFAIFWSLHGMALKCLRVVKLRVIALIFTFSGTLIHKWFERIVVLNQRLGGVREVSSSIISN